MDADEDDDGGYLYWYYDLLHPPPDLLHPPPFVLRPLPGPERATTSRPPDDGSLRRQQGPSSQTLARGRGGGGRL